MSKKSKPQDLSIYDLRTGRCLVWRQRLGNLVHSRPRVLSPPPSPRSLACRTRTPTAPARVPTSFWEPNKPGGSLIIPQRARLSHWACSVARPRSGGEWLSWAQGSGRRPLRRGFQECGPGAAAPEPGARRGPRSPPGRRAQPEPRRSGTRDPPTSRQVRNRPPGEPCK